MIATIAEIEKFLQEFKQKVEVFDIIFGMKEVKIPMHLPNWTLSPLAEKRLSKQSLSLIIRKDQ